MPLTLICNCEPRHGAARRPPPPPQELLDRVLLTNGDLRRLEYFFKESDYFFALQKLLFLVHSREESYRTCLV